MKYYGYHTFFISYPDYFQWITWNFIEFFDDFILSHLVHMTKPDINIFKYAIKVAGCKPEEIIYVDDGLNNINIAKSLNINAIHFTDVENLKEEFRKLNIIT